MRDWDQRLKAAQSCVDRFKGQPFAWGQNDCVRLVAHALRERGFRPRLLGAGRYSTEMGALKAMRRAGFSDLLEAMDAQGFARIAPAATWPGDVVAMPGEGTFGGGLCVRTMGVGLEGIGFVEGEGHVVKLLDPIAAWRVV